MGSSPTIPERLRKRVEFAPQAIGGYEYQHTQHGPAGEAVEGYDVELDLRAADLIDSQAAELTRLREVVEKLPKTADGVPVVPGMYVWLSDGTGPGEIIDTSTYTKSATVNDFFKWPDYKPDNTGCSQRPLSSLYSTRAAAQSTAQKGESDGLKHSPGTKCHCNSCESRRL